MLAALAVLAVLAVPSATLPASGARVRAGVPPPADVVSTLETPGGPRLTRDCGYAEPLSGPVPRAFWLFCDTVVRDREGVVTAFIAGTTAAIGRYTPGLVPRALREVPGPGPSGGPGTPAAAPRPSGAATAVRGPERFLPVPEGLRTPGGAAPCDAASGAYAASWATGMTTGPAGPLALPTPDGGRTVPDASRLLFLTYTDTCVSADGAMTGEANGIAVYDPAAGHLVATGRVFGGAVPDAVQQPWWRQLGSPLFHDGHLHQYAFRCDEADSGMCRAGRVVLARVPVDRMWSAADHRWLGPGGEWTADPGEAVPLLPAGTGEGPFSVHVAAVAPPGSGYVLIEQTSVGGHFAIWRAPAPAGPWSRTSADRVADCDGSRQPTGFCYAFIAHPELSTHTSLLFSYFDPAHGNRVRVAATPW